MASSFTLPILNKSQFLGQTHTLFQYKPICTQTKSPSNFNVSAKFDLYQILGGRGLLNGEQGVEKELKKSAQEVITIQETSTDKTEEDIESSSSASTTTELNIITEGGEGDFEKELSGLTGGFPGGEKGLQKFIKNNPVLKIEKPSKAEGSTSSNKKPKAPQLPLFMPGMIAIVKNENNPFYMYCGIVQRITDGRAGVLFEGGNWDKLVTFRLDELERREKGPPMKNPRSCVLEQPPLE